MTRPAPKTAEPRVPAELVNGGRQLRVTCPYCGKDHVHGAGDPDDADWPLYGGRCSHCHRGGYVMVPPGSEKP